MVTIIIIIFIIIITIIIITIVITLTVIIIAIIIVTIAVIVSRESLFQDGAASPRRCSCLPWQLPPRRSSCPKGWRMGSR